MLQSSLRISRYQSKINKLIKRIADTQSASSNPSFSYSSRRLENAMNTFQQLKCSEFSEHLYQSPEEILALDQRFYDLYTKTVVDLDACIAPEIDPNEGWVLCSSNNFDYDEEEEFVIDTQLMTLSLKPSLSAGLIEWLFKPRKLNFLFSFSDLKLNPSFVSGICDPEGNLTIFDTKVSEIEITRHTPDQVELRIASSYLYHGVKVKIFSEYLVKAGLGAYRQNSTTGFSYNYWYEFDSPFPHGYKLVLRMHPIMPSRDASATEAYLLHSVGAVNTEAFPLSNSSEFFSGSYPQGLHGLRIVDTHNPYAMDVRSSRPLTTIKAEPFFESKSSLYCGSTIELGTSILPDSTSLDKNTIFVSLI